MPENFEVNKGGPQTAADDAFLRLLAEAANTRDERPVRPLMPNGNCMRCHIPQHQELRFTPLDFGSLSRNRLLERKIDLPEQTEDRAVEQFRKGEPLEKVIQVLARMPENVSLQLGADSLALRTDFTKLAQSIPGIKLEGATRELVSSLESVSLQGDRFTAKLNAEKSIPIQFSIPILGKTKEITVGDKSGALKFDLEIDADKTKTVSLKNITGLSLKLESGKTLSINELTVDNSTDKPVLKVTIDNPATKPVHVPEKLWPKTISVPIPLEKVAPGLTGNFVQGTLKALADARALLKDKDFKPFLQHLPEQGLRNTADALLKGVRSIDKNGDQIIIRRNNGEIKHDLGGPDLKIDAAVRFRVGKDAAAPRVFDIQGVTVSVPLPEELKAGARYAAPITEVSLGYRDGNGNRDLVVGSQGLVDRVQVRLNSQMQPVKDGSGNWNVNVRMKNLLSPNSDDKIDVPVRLGADGRVNMKPSEILDIVSKASGQASDFSFQGIGLGAFSIEAKIASGVAHFFGW